MDLDVIGSVHRTISATGSSEKRRKTGGRLADPSFHISRVTGLTRFAKAKCDRRSLRRRGESTHRNSVTDVDGHQILTELDWTTVDLAHQSKGSRRIRIVVREHRKPRLDALEDGARLRAVGVMVANRLYLPAGLCRSWKAIVGRAGQVGILFPAPHFVNQDIHALRHLDEVVRRFCITR